MENSLTATSTEYYCQWFDVRREIWVTPTGWLRSGGYDTIENAQTRGVAFCRQDSPNVRVRIVCRVKTTIVLGEAPVPEHDKH